MLCSSDSLAFFLFVLAFLTCEGQEEYICKRLVTEKYRCEIFNYRHPLCKKWDHSQCPPPRIIRDLSPCVSYSCVREGKKKEWNTVARTTPIPTTAATVVTDTKETVEGVSQNVVNKNQTSSAQSALSALSSKNQVDIQTLTNQITRLRRKLRVEEDERQQLQVDLRHELQHTLERVEDTQKSGFNRSIAHLQEQLDELRDLIDGAGARETVAKLQEKLEQRNLKVSKTKLKNAELRKKKAFYKKETQRLQNELNELKRESNRSEAEELRQAEEPATTAGPDIESQRQKNEDITTVRSLLNSKCPKVNVTTKLFETFCDECYTMADYNVTCPDYRFCEVRHTYMSPCNIWNCDACWWHYPNCTETPEAPSDECPYIYKCSNLPRPHSHTVTTVLSVISVLSVCAVAAGYIYRRSRRTQLDVEQQEEEENERIPLLRRCREFLSVRTENTHDTDRSVFDRFRAVIFGSRANPSPPEVPHLHDHEDHEPSAPPESAQPSEAPPPYEAANRDPIIRTGSLTNENFLASQRAQSGRSPGVELREVSSNQSNETRSVSRLDEILLSQSLD